MNNALNTTTNAAITSMTSKEIAELTGKRHDHVLVDVRTMLEALGLGAPEFSGTYSHPQNSQSYPCFVLPKDLTMTLVSGYNVVMRHRIVTRWQALEAGVVEQAKVPAHVLPTDYLSALKELITSLECQGALTVENESLKEELVVRVDISKWRKGSEIRAEVGIHGVLRKDLNIAFANEMDDIAKDLGVPTHIKDVNGTTFYATNMFHPEAAKVWIERHPMYQRKQLPVPVTNHVVLPFLRH